MARKWSIFFYRVKSLIKQVVRIGFRPKGRITFIILALLGFISTQALPAISAQRQDVMQNLASGKTFQVSLTSNALELAQKGLELYQAGQIESAIESWEKAADIYDKMGDRAQARSSLLNKAAAEQALGYYPRSYKTIARSMGLDNGAEKRLRSEIDKISNILEKEPENRDARGQLRGAIAEMTAATAGLNKARGLRLLGEYFQQTGKLEISSLILQESKELATALGENAEASAALVSWGNAERAIGEKKQAEKNPLEEASQLVMLSEGEPNINIVKWFLKDYEKALSYYKEAADVSQNKIVKIQAKLNHFDILTDIKIGLLKAIASAGDTDLRVERVRKEFLPQLNAEIGEEVESLLPDIPSQLDSLPGSRKTVYSRIKLAQSLKALERETATTAKLLATAAKEAEDLGDPKGQSYALGNLGTLYEEKKRWNEAERVTESALSIASASEAPEIAYQWRWQLGRILAAKSERKKAIAAYDAAFNTLKSLRKDLAASDRNINFSFRDSIEPLYRQYVSLLVRSDASSSPEELKQAREVIEQLQKAELDDFFGDPCSEVANKLEDLDKVDKKAAIIYPIILEDRLEVILKLPEQDLQHYGTLTSRKKVEEIINQLRRQVDIPPELQQSPDDVSSAKKLYNWLIRPAAADLKNSKVETLVFVLDGPLRNIPMAALYDGQEYLIQKYNIALTTGLELSLTKPLQPENIKVLAAGVTKEIRDEGFPEIENVKQELKSIENIVEDTEVLFEEEFTKEKLKENLKESAFPVVHLATHGRFDSNPEDTFIITGDELGSDRININELEELLKTSEGRAIELLVLSACETASGDARAPLGLAGVAVRAGAKSTIATLWLVNDKSTAELMDTFYRNLVDPNISSKVEALREAQRNLLDNPQYNHPYYWAPFVLVGNWL